MDSSTIIKQLYPDQETYRKKEQRRFEILDAQAGVTRDDSFRRLIADVNKAPFY